ncbi:MAG TPA: hypothetical protein VEL09_06510 [Burkholderiales bacterium]|nr:hypothetical protein [Burkholderiales bacterium]
MMQRMGSRLRLLGFAALALLVSGCGTIKYMKEMPAGTAVKAPAPGTPESEQWARENMDSIRSKHAENYSRWNQKSEKEKPHLASADAV